jgi:hypothetical protein
MGRSTAFPDDLLFHSEATLRLMDELLQEIRGADLGDGANGSLAAAAGTLDGQLTALPLLPQIFLKAYVEVARALEGVHRMRDVIDEAAADGAPVPPDCRNAAALAMELEARLERLMELFDDSILRFGADLVERPAGELAEPEPPEPERP